VKNILRSAVLSAVMALSAQSAMADVTVSGAFLKFGVGDNGSLIDFGTFTGIQFDPTGTGNFAGKPDFITPGIPFSYFSLGVNGTWDTAGGYSPSYNPFTSTTGTFNGAGTTFVITSNGNYQGLKLSQVISFDLNSNIIHTNVVLTNVSGGTLANVVYGTGLDPDQDATGYGVYSTINSIGGQGVGASVSALGANSGLQITMSNTSGWVDTTASVNNWQTDPYFLTAGVTNVGDGDNAIALGYKFGDMHSGQQISIGYDYTITAAVPEPETYAMLLVGLGVAGFLARRRKPA